MERIKKELEEWKEKARSLRTEVDALKAKYDQLSKEHEKMKEKYAECEAKRFVKNTINHFSQGFFFLLEEILNSLNVFLSIQGCLSSRSQ